MAGFGPYLEPRGTGVHDRLKALAVVLELAGKRISIVSCDLIAMTIDMTRRVRFRVEEAAGISGNQAMVSATHTHSSPSVPRSIGWGEQDEQYLSDLHEKIAQAVIQAANQLQPVEVFYGEAPVEELRPDLDERVHQRQDFLLGCLGEKDISVAGEAGIIDRHEWFLELTVQVRQCRAVWSPPITIAPGASYRGKFGGPMKLLLLVLVSLLPNLGTRLSWQRCNLRLMPTLTGWEFSSRHQRP